MNCLGCNLANKKEQVNVVFEDDYVCCFLDHNPYNEGHVLILPKKHIRYLLFSIRPFKESANSLTYDFTVYGVPTNPNHLYTMKILKRVDHLDSYR